MSQLGDYAAELGKNFRGEIRLDLASRVLYSTDASIYQIEPLGVAFPRTAEDLQSAVELAAKFEVPILARGAGTSLAGQAIGKAIILDCSRWLNRILEIDPHQRFASVEPGVVLATLNQQAAKYGLQFGPDPASAERATMGGVIANNSTGAHSIVYGMAADHLRSANVVLADGSLVNFGEIRERQDPGREGPTRLRYELPTGFPSSTRFAAIFEAACEIRERYADSIRTDFPRTWRNSAGYRLNYLLPWSATTPPEWTVGSYPANLPPGTFNLAHLLAGSEGTLAVVSQATVGLVPKPKTSLLGILPYSSIEAACDALPELLKRHPSAIELLPRMIIQMAKRMPEYGRGIRWVRGDPAALLIVEFSGAEERNLKESVLALGPDVILAETEAEQASVWRVRQVGLGILDSRPQSARPAAFIEDCAIPVEHLGVFVREIQRIMVENGVEGGIYGHASAGCLHIKPVLDLKTDDGRRRLRTIAEQTLILVLRLGGSMSSEHGDGIARGEWLRRTYGEQVLAAMQSMKQTADPQGLLGPHKMLDAPLMDTHLRPVRADGARDWKPGMDFARNGGLPTAIEQCNGQGVCRKLDGTMCPSFQATRDEMHSTRGRANLLRAMILTGMGSASQTMKTGPTHVKSPLVVELRPELSAAVFQALDLCLACKACKNECPSGVDMAKLKAVFQERYYQTHRRPLRDYIFGYFHVTARILSAIAPAVNAASSIPAIRNATAKFLNISPSRAFPKFTWRTAHPRRQEGLKPVWFLRDAFTHHVDRPVEQAAFDVMETAGFQVNVLDTVGAGAALVSKGFLKAARRQAKRLVDELARRDPAGEYPIVCIEPSELSTLKQDYPDLLPDLHDELPFNLRNAQTVDDLLVRSGQIHNLPASMISGRILFHPHCHERIDDLEGEGIPSAENSSVELLRSCGYEVSPIEAGCCGMAGTFGYEKEHYDLSRKIGALRLFPRILESEGAVIAVTGGACRLHISQSTNRVAVHPLILVARALDSARKPEYA